MRRAFCVAGLLFGDEGKGSTTDYLCRKYEASLVVRYNGGPQAAHNVVNPDGSHHTFSQFGSGSFYGNTGTYLSSYMLVDPLALLAEADALQKKGLVNILDLLFVSEDCVVVTPIHQAVNHLLELSRGDQRHGSCGIGLGVARENSLLYPDRILRMKHLSNKEEVANRLKFIQTINFSKCSEIKTALDKTSNFSSKKFDTAKKAMDWFRPEWIDFLVEEYYKFPESVLCDSVEAKYLLDGIEVIVFEGAQGVLLDEKHGYLPHVTWTDTTFGNIRKIIRDFNLDANHFETNRIGCLRPYATRHGAGPLLHESSDLAKMLPEDHNKSHDWAEDFRVGYLDLQEVRKSVGIVGGIDQIALSCLDRLTDLDYLELRDGDWVGTFPVPSEQEIQSMIIYQIQERISIPITILGYGPKAIDRVERLPYLYTTKDRRFS